MRSNFLLLLAMCALAAALPRDKRSAESNSDESGEFESTTTAKPFPSKIVAIEDASELETRISQAGDKLVIIYFMTTWCPHCKKINATIEDVAAKTENLIVLKVDRDQVEEDDTVWKYGLSDLPSVPRFIFIKNGKKVQEVSGSDTDIRGILSKITSPSTDSSNSSDSSDE